MKDRPIPRTPEGQTVHINGIISQATQLAAREGSPVNPTQVGNVVGHMFAAMGYLFEADAYVFGAEKIVFRSGGFVSKIDAQVGGMLTKLGHALMEVDVDVVDGIIRSQGFVPHSIPENRDIYEQMRSGNIDEEKVSYWLLNTPAKRNLREES